MAQSGVKFRMMTERAILVVGIDAAKVAADYHAGDASARQTLLGWYLPPLPPGTGPRWTREATRNWRPAELALLDHRIRIVLGRRDSEGGIELAASPDPNLCKFVQEVEDNAEALAEDIGYERLFVRRLVQAGRSAGLSE